MAHGAQCAREAAYTLVEHLGLDEREGEPKAHSALPLRGETLVAFVDGAPWAALSLDDGRIVADPFRRSASVVDLHGRIATASGNGVLIGCLRDLDQMQRLSPLRTAADPATRDAAFGELEVLVQRVSGGDADGAAAAMRSHLASVGAGPRNL